MSNLVWSSEDAPFSDAPTGEVIAKWFVNSDAVDVDRQGCEGWDLWRQDGQYVYLWVEAMVDHDMNMYYLLEIRSSRDPGEDRQHMFVSRGVDGIHWAWLEDTRNPFADPKERGQHKVIFKAAMQWFADKITERM